MAILDILRQWMARSAAPAAGACPPHPDPPPHDNSLYFDVYGDIGISSPEKAMKVAAVYSCVKLISEGIAKLPLELKRFDHYGNYYRPDTRHPLFAALNIKPNRTLTRYDMLRSAVGMMLLRGNAYIYPMRNAYGEVDTLVLLSPGTVSHDTLNDTYYINDSYNGIFATVGPDRIVHLKNIGLDGGRSGISTLRMAAIEIGLITAADKELTSLFKSGGRQRGIISGDSGGVAGFGAQQEKQLRDVSVRIERDLAEGKRIVPLNGAFKFGPFSMTPADAKMLENKQFTVKEIGRFFRVHPSMLYEDGGSTYSNAEMDQVTFLNGTLAPLLVQIENELQVKLIDRAEWGDYKILFDREPMYNTDLTTEAAYITASIAAGLMTVNDWRRRKGLAPLPGGDEPMISANLVSLQGRKMDEVS